MRPSIALACACALRSREPPLSRARAVAYLGRVGRRAQALVGLAAAALGPSCNALSGVGDLTFHGGGAAGAGGASGEGGAGPISGATSTSTSTSSVSASTGAPASATSSAGGGSTAQAATSTTGSSGQATVPCASDGTECAPGEVCCFHESEPFMDHCGGAGTCGADYHELACDGPEDCAGQVCCATFGALMLLQGIECKQACSGRDETVACGETADCASGTCNPRPSVPGYAFCARL